MPVYTREDILGKIEMNGKVKCSACMGEDDMILEDREAFITRNDKKENVYICDYCNATL